MIHGFWPLNLHPTAPFLRSRCDGAIVNGQLTSERNDFFFPSQICVGIYFNKNEIPGSSYCRRDEGVAVHHADAADLPDRLPGGGLPHRRDGC